MTAPGFCWQIGFSFSSRPDLEGLSLWQPVTEMRQQQNIDRDYLLYKQIKGRHYLLYKQIKGRRYLLYKQIKGRHYLLYKQIKGTDLDLLYKQIKGMHYLLDKQITGRHYLLDKQITGRHYSPTEGNNVLEKGAVLKQEGYPPQGYRRVMFSEEKVRMPYRESQGPVEGVWSF